MPFIASSMVRMRSTAVTAKKAMPIAVSRPAFCVKELICSAMVSTPRASGRKFFRMNSCSTAMVWSNTGNAVEMASATVNSGTSDSSVV